MSDMEEKFLNYDIPNFVKESPNYLKLFEKERIILKNNHDKWGSTLVSRISTIGI